MNRCALYLNYIYLTKFRHYEKVIKFISISHCLIKKQRPPGGGRPLIDKTKVFDHNNWDNVEWDAEQEADAKKKVEAHSQTLVDENKQAQYEAEADRFWDEFYGQHQNRFFKDRHWLFTEFPELLCGMQEKFLSKYPEKISRNSVDNTDIGDVESKVISENSSSDSVAVTSSPTDMDGSIADSLASDSSFSDLSKDLNISENKIHDISNKKHIPKFSDSELTDNGPLNVQDISNDPNKSSVDKTTYFKDTGGSTNSSETTTDTACGKGYPSDTAKFRVFEVGCGVGNTVFPILETNNDPGVFIYCCDLSPTAIQLIKDSRNFEEKRCHAFVCDVTNTSQIFPFPEESLDVITLIFVMSAIHPDKMQDTINRLSKALKPGGVILFRDYGRYDLAQLRFKNGRCLSENFYVRGDGTRVYFFTQEELREMFVKAGLVEKQNSVDRRLQVNRGKMVKMYRVWIQCKYMKAPVKTVE